jgi:hypothetical protein
MALISTALQYIYWRNQLIRSPDKKERIGMTPKRKRAGKAWTYAGNIKKKSGYAMPNTAPCISANAARTLVSAVFVLVPIYPSEDQKRNERPSE